MLAVHIPHSCRWHVATCFCKISRMLSVVQRPILKGKRIVFLSTNYYAKPAWTSNHLCTLVYPTTKVTRNLCTDSAHLTKVGKGTKLAEANEETKKYLTSLGLYCEAIWKGKPAILFEDVSRVKQHVTFLQSLTLSNSEILDILKKTPELLNMEPSVIQKHLDYLEDLGLDGVLVLNILQRVPKFFTTPLSKIQSNVEFILTLNLTKQNIRVLFKYTPSLFYRRTNGIRNAGDCLARVILEHDKQCIPEKALRYMLRVDPLLFGRTPGEIEHRVQHLINLGFTGQPLARIIRFCPSVLRIGTEFIDERIQLVQTRLCLSDEEALDMVMRLPRILHSSNENIETKIDFLFQKGYTSADIYRNPRVLSASLARIESRLEKLTQLKFRPKKLNIMQKSEEQFDDFLEKLRQMQKASENKQKHSNGL